ncbi:hypothetical protein AURDEDRAFT_71775 [Auricularia subglabra TFB-10046 SS5]|nr:hypothetical protein AURDEDRAFT_71775 [Auricularia subglabra TFB-10046 SS5]
MTPLILDVAASVIDANGGNARCGVAVSSPDPDFDTVLLRLDEEWASTECGTLTGLLWVLEWIDSNTPLRIRLQSMQVLSRMTKDLQKHLKSGWTKCKRFHNLYRSLANKLQSWEAKIVIEDGRGLPDFEAARDSAREALTTGVPTVPDQGDSSTFEVPGRQLAGITQNEALQTIRLSARVPERRSTFINVGRTKCAVAEMNGWWPTTQELWLSLRSKDIYKPTREFLWRLVHGTQKVGNFWLNVPNREALSECPPCEVTESMDHVLLECDAPGRAEVWAEARSLWSRTGHAWPDMSLGLITGCALVDFRDQQGKSLRGLSRLFRIVVSESAFLIWKLRNERRIQRSDSLNELPTKEEIVGRWRNGMERRFRIDAHWTNTRRFKKKALNPLLLKETWGRVTIGPDGGATPQNWWAGPELLVSIWPTRPRGRER